MWMLEVTVLVKGRRRSHDFDYWLASEPREGHGCLLSLEYGFHLPSRNFPLRAEREFHPNETRQEMNEIIRRSPSTATFHKRRDKGLCVKVRPI